MLLYTEPKVEHETEEERKRREVRETLERALALLERLGWARFPRLAHSSLNTPTCLVGAISQVVLGERGYGDTEADVGKLLLHLGPLGFGGVEDAWHWNDRQLTAEPVLSRLRQAITRLS